MVEGEPAAKRADAPASVVDDVLHDTTDVTVSLGEVEGTETRRLLSVVRVGLKGGSDARSASPVGPSSLKIVRSP